MIFEFTDDQRAFADSVDALLQKLAPVSALRSAWSEHGADPALWDRLTEIGLPGLLVNSDLGGGGATAVDAALPIECAGYHAVAAPLAETAVVLPLMLAGETDADRAWLSSVAAGETRVATVTSGRRLAPHAAVADAFVLAGQEDVHLVPRDDVTLTPVKAMDPSLGLAEVDANTSPSTVIAHGADAVGHLRTLNAMTTALLLVGTSHRLLDLACAHALERHQFGRPIGSFQAIKHRLAAVAVDIEAARGLAWYAAYAAAHESAELARTAAHHAKAAASSAADAAGPAALQVHGGVGFTWGHELHLFLQRAKSLEVLHGTRTDHRRAAGLAFLQESTS